MYLQELDLQGQQMQVSVRAAEQKMRDSAGRVAQLESSLHVCQEELRVNLQRLEETRELAETSSVQHQNLVGHLVLNIRLEYNWLNLINNT